MEIDEAKEAENSKDNVIAVQWRVLKRLPLDERMSKCFICKTGDEETPLLQCQHKFKIADHKCSTHFHQACIDQYNAGGYDFNNIKAQRHPAICPLHVCHMCWLDRRKTSALQGKFIQCHDCMRAFHLTCSPANHVEHEANASSVVDGQGNPIKTKEVVYCLCSQHQVVDNKLRKLLKVDKKLWFCSECMEDCRDEEETLKGCGKCHRSFHEKCYRFGKVVPSGADDWCESCVLGEEFRCDEYVVARFLNSWYPARVVLPDCYPNTKSKRDKFGDYNAESGFVTVEWTGWPNTFAILPVQFCIQMLKGTIHYFSNSNPKSKNGWLELEQQFKEIPIPLPVKGTDFTAKDLSFNYTMLRKSTYYSDSAKPTAKEVRIDQILCDCPHNAVDRCGPKSNCFNRSHQHECPQACTRAPGGCSNRDVTTGVFCQDVEIRDVPRMGEGLFTKADLDVGTFIGEYSGEIIDRTERLKRVEQSILANNAEEMHYMFTIDANRVVDAKHKGNLSRFINHSCAPNCIVDTVTVVYKEKTHTCMTDNRLCITTIKPVKSGEQLFFDYGMEKHNENSTLQTCYCGAANCRGTLGKKSVNEEVRKDETKIKKKTEKRKRMDDEKGNEEERIIPQKKRRGRLVAGNSQKRGGNKGEKVSVVTTDAVVEDVWVKSIFDGLKNKQSKRVLAESEDFILPKAFRKSGDHKHALNKRQFNSKGFDKPPSDTLLKSKRREKQRKTVTVPPIEQSDENKENKVAKGKEYIEPIIHHQGELIVANVDGKGEIAQGTRRKRLV